MFNVINLETKEAWRGVLGAIVTYPSGKLAARAARELTEIVGIKHQPRRIVSGEWRKREEKRFLDGIYTPLPFDLPLIDGHYAHMSIEEVGKIAYTENENQGIADRQMRIKVGRYLERFYPSLDLETKGSIITLCAKLYASDEVKFATTPDDIVHVYENGPTSCMSRVGSDYACGHPTRVYGAGDLAIAYLERDERITARCLCWPEKKVYGTIYGDDVRLGSAIELLGYHEDTGRGFEGARLLNIGFNGGYVMPYIDNYYDASDKGEYLIIKKCGEIDGQLTNGATGCSRCSCCEEFCSEDDLYYAEGDNSAYCELCFNDNTFYCDATERSYSIDVTHYHMSNGETWCESYFERHGMTCEATGAYLTLDDSVVLVNGDVWSQEYFDSHGYQCGKCGECFANGDRCGDCDAEEIEPLIAGTDKNNNQIEMQGI